VTITDTNVDGLEHLYGPLPAPTKRRLQPMLLVAAMEPMSLRAVARRLGVDPALLYHPWSSAQADKHATKLGLHPVEVWGADYLRPDR